MCNLFTFSLLLLSWAIGLVHVGPVAAGTILDNALGIVDSFSQTAMTGCNLTNAATAPFNGSSTLLSPPASGNDTVLFLGIGSGYQNYTCASSSAIPAPMGGFANIFDASCIGIDGPFLSILPTALQNKPNHTALAAIMLERLLTNLSQSILLAQHYSTRTPNGLVANFDFTVYGHQGFITATVIEQGNAPGTSTAQSANWLHLVNHDASSTVNDIYRVWTSGGNATATDCANQPGQQVLTIPYAAVYYFYGPPPPN